MGHADIGDDPDLRLRDRGKRSNFAKPLHPHFMHRRFVRRVSRNRVLAGRFRCVEVAFRFSVRNADETTSAIMSFVRGFADASRYPNAVNPEFGIDEPPDCHQRVLLILYIKHIVPTRNPALMGNRKGGRRFFSASAR